MQGSLFFSLFAYEQNSNGTTTNEHDLQYVDRIELAHPKDNVSARRYADAACQRNLCRLQPFENRGYLHVARLSDHFATAL